MCSRTLKHTLEASSLMVTAPRKLTLTRSAFKKSMRGVKVGDKAADERFATWEGHLGAVPTPALARSQP